MILLPHLHESSGGRDSTSNMAALGRIYVYIYLYIYIYIYSHFVLLSQYLSDCIENPLNIYIIYYI